MGKGRRLPNCRNKGHSLTEEAGALWKSGIFLRVVSDMVLEKRWEE